MFKLRQIHQLARRSVTGAEYRLRNPKSTRRRGRRAIRGAVLLAGMLGSWAALAATGVPAYAANNNSLDFDYNIDSQPTWTPSTAAVPGTTYLGPGDGALQRQHRSHRRGTEPPAGVLLQHHGERNWTPSTVTGTGSCPAPAMVRSSTSTEVTAEEPNHSLYFYWNTDGSLTWQSERIAGPGTSYSAPAMVRSSDSTEVTAEGPSHQLEFYYNIDGQPAWHHATVAGPGTYSAPAMVRSSTSTEVTAEGPSHQLEFYWNVDGDRHWHHAAVGARLLGRRDGAVQHQHRGHRRGRSHQLEYLGISMAIRTGIRARSPDPGRPTPPRRWCGPAPYRSHGSGRCRGWPEHASRIGTPSPRQLAHSGFLLPPRQ